MILNIVPDFSQAFDALTLVNKVFRIIAHVGKLLFDKPARPTASASHSRRADIVHDQNIAVYVQYVAVGITKHDKRAQGILPIRVHVNVNALKTIEYGMPVINVKVAGCKLMIVGSRFSTACRCSRA